MRKYFQTNVFREMTITKNELKAFKKHSNITLEETGNNWSNGNSLSKHKDSYLFNSYEMADALYSGADYTLYLNCDNAIVSMHDYNAENIVHWGEQEVHFVPGATFKVVDISFNNFKEDKEIYIQLEMVESGVTSSQIVKHDYNLYKYFDEIFDTEILQ